MNRCGNNSFLTFISLHCSQAILNDMTIFHINRWYPQTLKRLFVVMLSWKCVFVVYTSNDSHDTTTSTNWISKRV